MAKSSEKPVEEKQKADAGTQPDPAAKSAPQRIELDDSDVQACYANFCRVNGTPEELVIDFGLNAQPTGTPSSPLKITQRLVINHYTAKRLLAALQVSIQRHEAAFGVLETDVQKRVLPAALRQSKPAQS